MASVGNNAWYYKAGRVKNGTFYHWDYGSKYILQAKEYTKAQQMVEYETILKHFFVWKKIPSVRIMGQDSHNSYVVLMFIHDWLHLQFKVGTERQIFKKVFKVILLECS